MQVALSTAVVGAGSFATGAVAVWALARLVNTNNMAIVTTVRTRATGRYPDLCLMVMHSRNERL